MTIKELSTLIGRTYEDTWRMFKKASSFSPIIASKMKISSTEKTVNYNLTEIEYALSFYTKTTPMLIQYVRDNYVERKELTYNPKTYKPKLKKDAKSFLFFYQSKGNKLQVCNTCAFLVPRKLENPNSPYKPYCVFHDKFIGHNKKYNVYLKKCGMWEQSEKTPLLWLGKGHPQNVDMFLNKEEDSILGLSPEEFVSKRKKDEPIVLVRPLC